ncbi:MAG: carboxypeptidase regulatory-like domain-containing protein [Acidobacteriota bacterium]
MTHHKRMGRETGWGMLLLAILALVWTPVAAWAQADRGTIAGNVTDPSGAVLGGVQVTATNTGTNIQYAGISNDHGAYAVMNLPIGTYTVRFKKDGFETLDRTGVVILANHTPEVDVQLTVGSVVQSVNVNANPVLDLQPEVGTNLTQEEVNTLPLSIAGAGRDQLAFAFAVTPNVGGDSWYSSVNGSQQYTKNVMIDGTSIDSGVMGDLVESGPSMDAVEQTQVDTTGIRAEEAHTGGGVFMLELKSGTNKWHGSAFGFGTNEAFDANGWLNNWYLSQCNGPGGCVNGGPSSQYERPRDRYWDYGFSGGGPIWKNHTFFYAAYEKYWQNDWRVTPNGATAPTTNMLNGNFSELLTYAGAGHCPSAPCPIMNATTNTPYTDAAGNTIYYGSIFLPNGQVAPGNVIPAGQWGASQISQKILGIYKQYYKPTGPKVVGNFPMIQSYDPQFQQVQFSIKVDHQLTTNDHLVASYIYNHRPKTEFETANSMWIPGTQNGGPFTPNSAQQLHTNAYRAGETHTFTPTLLNVLNFTFNQFQNIQASLAPASDYANTLGLQSAYTDKTKDFPQIVYQNSPNGVGESTIGSTYTGGYVAYNGIVNESLDWNKGRHDVKFGAEIRAIGFNQNGGDQGAYTFNFSNNTFAPDDPAIQPYVGFAFANMGLGEVASASQAVPFSMYSRRKEYGFFVQDDYKVTPKLTLNLDLRWDVTMPLHELHGYWSNFDVNAHDPHFGTLKGAYTWLQHPNDTFETIGDFHQFGPHAGFSYASSSKSVVRASYGIMYSPLANNQWSAVPYGSAVGFQGNNMVNPAGDVNHTGVPAFQWDSGYPGHTVGGTGPMPNQGYMQWGPAYIDPHSRQLGMIQNVFAGFEYEVRSDMRVDVNYNGAFGSNLHDGYGTQFNATPFATYSKLLTSGHATDWVSDQASAEAAGVNLPYNGWQQMAYNALVPFPQVATGWGPLLVANAPIGRSGYNAFTAEVTKRETNGLAMDMSYNWYRNTGNVCNAFTETWSWGGGCNTQDPETYNTTNWQTPTTGNGVKGYVTYELPVGRGERFLNSTNRLVNQVIGGWGVGAIVSYFNGSQEGAVWSTYFYPGWTDRGWGPWANVKPGANWKNTFKHYNPAWTPGQGSDPGSLFVDTTNFLNPTFGQLGNSPKFYPNWRGWATPTENASLTKKFFVTGDGRYNASIRADFFDLFNRHYWANPDMNMSDPAFGHVQGVSGNRTMQLGARFQF